MLEKMPISLIISSSVFFAFLKSQVDEVTKGVYANPLFFMVFSSISGMFGLGFLIYYGYSVAWYLPLLLFIISCIIGGIFLGLINLTINNWLISRIGYILIPLSGYQMVKTLINID